MKTKFYQFLLASRILLMLLPGIAVAQVPTCDANVPFYQVNLTGHPDSIWISPNHSRVGNCCGTTSPDNCTSFEVLLDTGAAMINFNIASGAIPTGAMFYQIGCGPQIPVGQPFCVVGPGPHRITFCKPGNNTNTYMVQSIPKPTFPPAQHVRIGCQRQLNALGLDPASVTWTSVYPGTPGQYDSYLSCTSACTNPKYTPASNAPAYIIYKVCGSPIASVCGYTSACDTFRIYNEQPLSSIVTPNPAAFCAGGSGVTLTASGGGGYGPYTFSWTDPSSNHVSSTSNCQATTAGSYTVEIRDGLFDPVSCPAFFQTVPVTLTSPPIVSAGIDQLVCHTNNTINLSGSVQFANGGQWSGGSGSFGSATSLNTSYTASSSEIASGSVTLSLTSTGVSGGCSNATDQVTINFAPALTLNMPNVSLPCNNSTTVLSPVITGAVGATSYAWSDGSTGSNISVNTGNFCVTVTDSLGCATNVCANVVAPSPLAITSHNISCPAPGSGVADISVNVSGGWQSSYQVSFDNGTTWLPAGNYTASLPVNATYTVLVKDNNGCSSPLAYPISINPEVTATAINYEKCFYGVVAASQVTVTPSGGAGGSYWVSVDGGVSYQNSGDYVITVPINSTYNIVVKDSNGCVSTASGAITLPDVLSSSATLSSYNGYNISCHGLSNGGIQVSTNGGTAPYTFSWNNSSSAANQTGLGAGAYSVVITDANNCRDTLSFTLNEPTDLSSAISATSNYNGYEISCTGSSDASINLTVGGGVTNYSYQWSTGATTEDISGIAAGTYSVIVTDANNCSDTAQVTIADPPALNSTININSNYNGFGVSCNGSTNGSINVQVSGGVAAYSYAWSNGSNAQNPTGLAAGTYSVVINDANNCKDTLSATITEPTPLTSTASVSTNFNGYGVTCNGASDATISATAAGGVTTYSYQWSNNATTQNINGVAAGSYQVVITDANGCQTNATVSVQEPAAITASLTIASNFNGYGISCNGMSDGALNAQASGGTPGYTFTWSNGSTSQNLTGLSAGNYTVTVTDLNGCSSSLTAPINQPPVLASSIVSLSSYNAYNISCAGSADGSINIQVNGGVPSYSYNWSNGSSSANQNNLAAGNYSVIITDANHCQDTLQATLTEPTPVKSNGTSSDHNGFSVSCFHGYDGAITTNVSGGVSPYTFAWSNGSAAQNPSILTAGTYSVVITDQNGCSSNLSFVLTEPTSVAAQGTVQNVLCNGFTNGGVSEQITGGVAPYTFNWSNGSTAQSLTHVGAGTYWYVVTDANNCAFSFAYTISETSPLNLETQQKNVTCQGMSDGNISSVVSGGTPGYTYQWSNGATQNGLSNIGPGNYVITVTDANHCTNTQTVTVTEPVVLNGSVSSPVNQYGFNESGPASSDGTVSSSISGGTTPYIYSWSNGATTADLSNVPAGTYTLTVTDQHGCKFTESVTLTAPLVLEMPSGISPNGDGLNDNFIVHGLELYPSNNIKIFNRWGNSVYEKDNYSQNWNGKNSSGADLPDGTYFVILKINNSDITLTGYVDVRR